MCSVHFCFLLCDLLYCISSSDLNNSVDDGDASVGASPAYASDNYDNDFCQETWLKKWEMRDIKKI